MSIAAREVRVELGERSYSILIGDGLLLQTGELAKQVHIPTGSAVLLVTDDHVAAAGHLERTRASLERAGYRVTDMVIRAGESSKNYSEAAKVFDRAFQAGLDRQSVIFALGGGVVGDLAGFVAATYMRGIRFIQLPTTVLAHDSSVGGKVAVNHPQGKNMIGAFHQPKLVVYDTSSLQTLPLREVRSGMAEVIKHGIIWDVEFFSWFEFHLDDLLALKTDVIGEMLARSCEIKAAVVAKDETEQNLRAILNFGHTLGHAIEALSQYGTYTHGEAVSIGMVYAAELSFALGRCDRITVERIRSLLMRTGLPITIPDNLDAKDLLESMKHDKKAAGGKLAFVLTSGIGHVETVSDVTEKWIVTKLAELRGSQE
jgi:3-dehydroquinate synthase